MAGYNRKECLSLSEQGCLNLAERYSQGSGFSYNFDINGGFETIVNTSGGPPTGYGYWSGDTTEIVSAMDGIVPYEGSRMLKFIYTRYDNNPGAQNASELYQIVDIGSVSNLVSSGQAVARASARFNRVSGDSETDTAFIVALYAYAGNPGTFPSQWSNNSDLSESWARVYTDDDPSTWEEARTELLLPPNTDFLVVQVYAAEDIINDSTGIEFDGHYSDSVSLEIVEN